MNQLARSKSHPCYDGVKEEESQEIQKEGQIQNQSRRGHRNWSEPGNPR